MQKIRIGSCHNVGILLLLFMVLLSLTGCGGNKSDPQWNLTGSSFLYHTTAGVAGEAGPDLFNFTQTANNLSGTTSQGQQLSGSMSGSDVDFSWTGSDGVAYSYRGTVSGDGTTMSGTWGANNGQSGTWHAIVNAAPAVNISGSWNIFHTTTGVAGETGPDPFTFTQTGNTLSGTTSQKQQVIGTVSSLSVTFSWAATDGSTLVYTGSAGATAMSGTWMSTDGRSGTWRATKSS